MTLSSVTIVLWKWTESREPIQEQIGWTEDTDRYAWFHDQHVHVTGGGGEGSFRTACRTEVYRLRSSRVTTLVGVLGTDGIAQCREPAI